MNDHAELANLGEHELKAAIKSEWKKHEELAKQELAPLLYYLRENIRAQGARNDLANTDRGFTAWVEANLDISRRTADRWCEWFAVEAGLKPGTSRQVTRSNDDGFYSVILDEHKGQEQIAFNCWVKTAIHTQFTKALAAIQKKLGLKNKKEAMVQGVLYAATAINGKAKSGSSATMVGQLSLRHHAPKTRRHSQVRATGRAAHERGKAKGHVQAVASHAGKTRNRQGVSRANGHRRSRSVVHAEGSARPKAFRATAG
jgi:hypothetical protein